MPASSQDPSWHQLDTGIPGPLACGIQVREVVTYRRPNARATLARSIHASVLFSTSSRLGFAPSSKESMPPPREEKQRMPRKISREELPNGQSFGRPDALTRPRAPVRRIIPSPLLPPAVATSPQLDGGARPRRRGPVAVDQGSHGGAPLETSIPDEVPTSRAARRGGNASPLTERSGAGSAAVSGSQSRASGAAGCRGWDGARAFLTQR